jgi:hypothetical protein
MPASVAGNFFKSINSAISLRMMALAGRELAVAHRAQFWA